MKKKSVALLMACMLVFGVAVGGTMAWLTATSSTVTNTFTVGDINIGLNETTGTDYPFVPGDDLAKDPTVTVNANSEDCWLFVKVAETNNVIEDASNNNKIVNWAIASGWTPYSENYPGYWYRSVSKSESAQTFEVFADKYLTTDSINGSVHISEKVTKGMITDENKPVITITAAAVQSAHFTVSEAWEELPSGFKPTSNNSQEPESTESTN